MIRFDSFVNMRLLFKAAIFAVLLKVCWVIILTICFQNLNQHEFISGWIVKHIDYSYFLQPVDNYFTHGLYSFDLKEPFAGRMPGYWFPYMVLRFVLTQNVALNVLILGQVLFAAAASVLAAEIVRMISGSSRFYYLVILLFCWNPFFAVFDTQTISESFSVSAFIVFIYAMVKAIKSKDASVFYSVLAGIFLAWSIFLRAYLGVTLVLVIPIFLMILKRNGTKRAILSSVFFLMPFIVFESAWLIRNYVSLNKVIPLNSGTAQYGKLYSDGWIESRKLIFLWGDQAAYFEPGIGQWFHQGKELPEYINLKDHIVPDYYGIDDIIKLRELHLSSLEINDEQEFQAMDSSVVTAALEMQRAFVENHPFRAYVVAPLLGLKRLVITSGSSYFPLPNISNLSIFGKVFKFFCAGMYYSILFLGAIGLLYLFKREKLIAAIFSMIILSTAAVLIFYSVIQEARYFIHVYALLIVLAAYFVHVLVEERKTIQSISA